MLRKSGNKTIFKKIVAYCVLFYSGILLIAGLSTPVLAFTQNYSLYQIIHHLLKLTCHQIAERCFYFLNCPMGICCRCFGIYIGIISVFSFFLIKNTFMGWKYSLILTFIGLAEKIIEILGIYGGNNSLRFISGIFLGTGMALMSINLLNFIEQILKKKGQK